MKEGHFTAEELSYIQTRALLIMGTIYEVEFIVEQLYAEFKGWA